MESLGVTLLVGFVFFLLGLFGNYFVNWTSAPLAQTFRKWRDDQAQKNASKSVKNAKKRIEKLEEELEKFTSYNQSPTKLNILAFLNFSIILAALSFGLFAGFGWLAINFLDPVGPPIENQSLQEKMFAGVSTISFCISIFVSMYTFNFMQRMFTLPSYEKDTRKQIADLQEVIKKFEDATPRAGL